MRTAAPVLLRRRLPRLAAAAALVLCATLLGCDGARDPISSSRADEAAPSADDTATGMVLQTSQTQRSGVGGACEDDDDCIEPLRCLAASTCARPPAIDGGDDGETDAPRALLDVERERPVRVYLEVADSFAERKRGLMWRTRMATDWGMLFVFPDEDTRSFWMKNTYLALDMIFIDADGRIVSISEDARPLNTDPRYTSEGPARYVLEVNAGFAREHALAAGQRVRLVDVEGEHESAILQ